MFLLEDDIIDSIDLEIDIGTVQDFAEPIVDCVDVLNASAEQLQPLVNKFSFLNRNKLLTDQILNFICIQNTVFVYAESSRYFYATMIPSVSMTANKFSFQIPYKQLCTIIKASAKTNEAITFTITEKITVTTPNSRWVLTPIQNTTSIDSVLKYYSIQDYIDTVTKSLLLDTISTFLPFSSLSKEPLMLDGDNAFCRSNHFYIWSALPLNEKYILSKDCMKLLQVFNNLKGEEVNITNIEDKTLFRCGEDLLVVDTILGDPEILKELNTLAMKQTVLLAKQDLQQALEHIDIFSKRNLFLRFQEEGIKLLNQVDELGTSETAVKAKQCNVKQVEDYSINYDVMLECIKCIKDKYLGVSTLNRSEYILIYTQQLKCLIMVNY